MSDVRVIRERMGAGVGVSGVAVLCCIHQVPKREVTALVADSSREQVKECPCCLNLYATEAGDPIAFCHHCRPRRRAR